MAHLEWLCIMRGNLTLHLASVEKPSSFVMLDALTGVEWRRDKKRPLLIKVPFTSQSPLGGEER